ncbi:MAG TPA: fumarate hydratase [Lachnospiraceae bacterium]|nr:fumarate hydratase [Lachnospiraceae bacterium]
MLKYPLLFKILPKGKIDLREIDVAVIAEKIAQMCISANYNLNDDVYSAIDEACQSEPSKIGKNILEQLKENADMAKQLQKPICQDTGMAVIFMDIGQDVHLVGGDLNKAVNDGVRKGYIDGFLRKSVVSDPLLRVNTKDNTPAVLHTRIVPGDKVCIDVAPKGFGSENMSKVYMLKPSDGIEGVKNAVIDCIEKAGPNPCPPMIVGVGIGGNFELVTELAKRALLRKVGSHNPIEYVKEMEEELLQRANSLGIGPQGLGGRTTVLGINIETYATHIAGLPLAVNISCHVTRHAHAEI